MIKFFQACYDCCYFVIILLVIVPTEQKKVGDDDNVVASVDSVPPNDDGSDNYELDDDLSIDNILSFIYIAVLSGFQILLLCQIQPIHA